MKARAHTLFKFGVGPLEDSNSSKVYRDVYDAQRE